MGSLNSQTVLVTGAAAGIGRATALAFAAEGAQVVVSDVNDAGGDEGGRTEGDLQRDVAWQGLRSAGDERTDF